MTILTRTESRLVLFMKTTIFCTTAFMLTEYNIPCFLLILLPICPRFCGHHVSFEIRMLHFLLQRALASTGKIKVAVNGFGRIGRNFVRCLETRGDDTGLELVAINDTGGVKQASHLLKYDSMLGTFDADIKIVDNSTISINGKEVTVVSSRDPTALPWGEMGIDLVIEGTGALSYLTPSYRSFSEHILILLF